VTRIAYLGPESTFTEAALLRIDRQRHGPEHSALPLHAGGTPTRSQGRPIGCGDTVPAESTAAALTAVLVHEADFACVPIENSIEGSVLPTLDSLATGTPLQIFAELTLDVSYTNRRPALAPRAPTSRRWRRSRSRPAQVRHWLATHLAKAQLVPANSNAAAAHDVSHGLADAAVNYRVGRRTLWAERAGVRRRRRTPTRAPDSCWPARRGPRRHGPAPTVHRWCCASIMQPRRWCRPSRSSRSGGIDLTRIESRPTRTELDTCIFFLDCVGHIEDAAVAEALMALHRRCADVRYLGSWPTDR